MLVYSTAPLIRGISVMGEVTGTLYVSSSALDTDVMVKLIDVYPDGRAFNLYDAALRCVPRLEESPLEAGNRAESNR